MDTLGYVSYRIQEFQGHKKARVLQSAGFAATPSAMHSSHSPPGSSTQHVHCLNRVERPRIKDVTSRIVRQPLKILFRCWAMFELGQLKVRL